MLTLPTHRTPYGLGTETLNVRGLRTHFSLCHVTVIPEDEEARRVFQGPMIPGPWCFVTPHALVIDNHGGSAREREEAIPVEAGEPLLVEGLPGQWTFCDRDQRKLEGDGPKLVPFVTPTKGAIHA